MPEQEVHITSWPKEPAKLEHKLEMDKPCPVSISFEETPANVIIHTSPEQPFHVDMAMNVLAKETIPVCIKLCEPICVESNYTIGIDIFDRPVAAITLRGLTRLFNCREQEPPVVVEPPTLVCVDFRDFKHEIVYKESFYHDELKFSPLGNEIRTSTIGDPPSQVKLAFPREGIRIDFPQPVSIIRVTVNNYADPRLHFLVYAGNTLITQFEEQVNNEVKEIVIEQSGVTAIEIKGGDNEASVVKICYLPD